MGDRILFVLTSHSELGSSGYGTGSWLEELAQPYYALTEAGHEVVLATLGGGAAPMDPMSLETQWISPAGQRFMSDATAQAAMGSTVDLAGCAASDYAAVFFVGGAGVTFDLVQNPVATALVEAMDERQGLIASICHGGIVLAYASKPDGTPMVRGRQITAISNAEDALAGLDKIVPCLPEDALRRACAIFIAAPPFAPNVVQDGNLVTAQNPASALPLAQALLARLEERRKAA